MKCYEQKEGVHSITIYAIFYSYQDGTLHSFQSPNLATLSCRFSYCASFLHSLTKCWVVSHFSLHIQHNGLSVALSIKNLAYFVRIACSCAAHNNASLLAFKSPCPIHLQDFSLSQSKTFLSQIIHEFSFHATFSSVLLFLALLKAPCSTVQCFLFPVFQCSSHPHTLH